MMVRIIEDIRREYGVPARIRGRVLLDGAPAIITGTWGGNRLLVRKDGEMHSRIAHPVTDVTYIREGGAKCARRMTTYGARKKNTGSISGPAGKTATASVTLSGPSSRCRCGRSLEKEKPGMSVPG